MDLELGIPGGLPVSALVLALNCKCTQAFGSSMGVEARNSVPDSISPADPLTYLPRVARLMEGAERVR